MFTPPPLLTPIRSVASSSLALAIAAGCATARSNPEATGGVLRLQWDRTELVVPFRARER
jgi:hypothetical protein